MPEGTIGKNLEITEEMIAAGVKAASLYDSCDDLEMIVRDVFRAMLSHAAGVPSPHESSEWDIIPLGHVQ